MDRILTATRCLVAQNVPRSREVTRYNPVRRIAGPNTRPRGILHPAQSVSVRNCREEQ
jgi:hypothetical protein